MSFLNIIASADVLSLLVGRAEEGAAGRVRLESETPIVMVPALIDAIEQLQPPAPSATLRPRVRQGGLAR